VTPVTQLCRVTAVSATVETTAPPTVAQIHAALTAPGQPFEIEEAVVRGVPLRVWKATPRNLPAVLEASRAHADRDLLVYDGPDGLERTTFEEHYRQCATLAHRLREQYGVAKGDRVAIAMRNFPEWALSFWGAAGAGAVVVPLNAWGTGPELEYALRDSGAKVLIADEARLQRLAEHLPSLELTATFVVRGEHPGALPFSDLVQDAAPDATLPEVDLEPDDYATIFYTSGTTGRPKGVLGTHRNICTNLVSLTFAGLRGALRSGQTMEDIAAVMAEGKQNAYLLSVPFFHATGCHSVLVANTAIGNKITIMHKWNPDRALEMIEQEKITTFGGVPSMVLQVLASPNFEKTDISSVVSIGYGGAPAPPELVRRIEALFPGRSASNGYGLTETSSVTSMNAGADYFAHPDSVGIPVPVCDVRVVDPLGEQLPTGEAGELEIRGPNVVVGYWNNPQATADSFAEGWLRTGDIAKIDEEGFIYLVDRAKDLIIRGGENIGSAEVEGALHEHPAVSDAAVFGWPHPVLGEEVAAVVTLRTVNGAQPSEEELRAHVAERLAAFKVPSRIFIREQELPRNPAGKILKRNLRTELLDAHPPEGS
jgi:long-chain acyl-CoA synthetase